MELLWKCHQTLCVKITQLKLIGFKALHLIQEYLCCMYIHLFLYACDIYSPDMRDIYVTLLHAIWCVYVYVCKMNKLILNTRSSTGLHILITKALFSAVQRVAFRCQHMAKSDKVLFNKTFKYSFTLIYQDPCTLNLWHWPSFSAISVVSTLFHISFCQSFLWLFEGQ
jgi:hypothetical protein